MFYEQQPSLWLREHGKFNLFSAHTLISFFSSPPIQYSLRPTVSARYSKRLVFVARWSGTTVERLSKDSLCEFHGSCYRDHHTSLYSPWPDGTIHGQLMFTPRLVVTASGHLAHVANLVSPLNRIARACGGPAPTMQGLGVCCHRNAKVRRCLTASA
jgi:hypothetical protein